MGSPPLPWWWKHTAVPHYGSVPNEVPTPHCVLRRYLQVHASHVGTNVGCAVRITIPNVWALVVQIGVQAFGGVRLTHSLFRGSGIGGGQLNVSQYYYLVLVGHT